MQVEEPELQVSSVPRGHGRPHYIPLSPQVPDTEAVVLYPEGCEDRVSLAGRSVHMSSSITQHLDVEAELTIQYFCHRGDSFSNAFC